MLSVFCGCGCGCIRCNRRTENYYREQFYAMKNNENGNNTTQVIEMTSTEHTSTEHT